MIAISGSDGFIGKHCKIYCKINNIKDVLFLNKKNLKEKETKKRINKCKSFIHLAGINRENQGNLVKKNLEILKKHLNLLDQNTNLKNIIFTSSIHRNSNNDYAKSKLQCEKILKKFTNKKKINLKIIILPNVFGEFCKPNYNSVVATFSNNLMNNIECKININKHLKLIYVQDVVKNIFYNLNSKKKLLLTSKIKVISVKSLKKKLELYKQNYFLNQIPKFINDFDLNLFNTFRSYAFPNKLALNLKLHKDNRGSLWEVIKSEKKTNIIVSTTKKGVERGNHFHTKKIEKFIILKGKAVIKFRYIFEKKIYKIKINSNKLKSIDIPSYCTHSLTNTNKEDLLTMFYSNEIFNPLKPDTYYEKVIQ